MSDLEYNYDNSSEYHDDESSALANKAELELEEEGSNLINTFLEGRDFRDMVKHDLRGVIRSAVMRADYIVTKDGHHHKVFKNPEFYRALEDIICEAVKEGVHDYFYQRGYNDE